MGPDICYALRAIRKQPGFSFVVAITLALGIGLNATVFGMMDAMLLRPFQFPDHERIVVLWETVRGGSDRDPVSPATYLEWRDHVESVERLTAWEFWDATQTVDGEAQPVSAVRVSPGFFELLGRKPVIGRSLLPDEATPGNHRKAVISDALWTRRFGANPHVAGTDIRLNGEPWTIVGVAPPGFDFPAGAEVWTPLALDLQRASDRANRSLNVAGKLPTGRTLQDAQAEMDIIASRQAREHPDTHRDRTVSVMTLSQAFREASSTGLFAALWVSAGLVLLVACMNIAGLLLARGVDRQRELAVRAALGASRMTITRQLITETVVLALVSSALAVLIAGVSLQLLRSSLPPDMTRYIEGWNNLGWDMRLTWVIPAIALFVGLAVGLLPALATSRTISPEALRESGRGVGRGRGSQRVRQTMVVAEIAFALALLIAAGLTVAGGIRLVTQPGGFDAQRLLTVHIPLPEDKYFEEPSRRDFARVLMTQVASRPGVEAVALANVLPAAGWSPSRQFTIEHAAPVEPAHLPRAGYRAVSAGFFEAMRIPVVHGRSFTDVDRERSEPVAIVSASVAQRHWPGEDPVGRRILLGGTDARWLQIVGVVGDVNMYNWWDGLDHSAIYVPLLQAPPQGHVQIAVRSRGEPGLVAASIREALSAVDPALPLHNVRSMRQAIDQASLGLTWMAWLLGICGAIGAVLAVIGIYSVMAYAVSQRRHEFGVRMALGATTGDVLHLTLNQAGIMTAAGIAVGVLLAAAFAIGLANSLVGIIAIDIPIFIFASAALAIASLAAAWLPARSAIRVDPAVVLRGD